MSWQEATLSAGEAEYGELAEEMVEKQLAKRGIHDDSVLMQLRTVPRHAFLTQDLRRRAYADCALPTMNDQTISQPYVVGLMSQMLAIHPGHRVLEIGTGSGYQTAILSGLVGPGGQVDSIERDSALADHARTMLKQLGVPNATVAVGDGTLGHPSGGPYDRILVTAGAPDPPPSLCEQLVDGGRMVIPLGNRTVQKLTTIERDGKEFRQAEGLSVRFVPLRGEQGWTDELSHKVVGDPGL